ncbi:hypothetical protein V6Z11_A10G246500 [Gossypium hirsutum]|uniref:Keratin-associated protein 5-1-like n=2 Tax=Gossypium TaxID=3633 RepID=A0ABM2YXB8_GOSHI|nr:keratin-associated protein 5-1-like [Gossypium hirsutum]PPR83348.1 hypothetical protein GOBAR_AA37364 [Gossypium barbadense]
MDHKKVDIKLDEIKINHGFHKMIQAQQGRDDGGSDGGCSKTSLGCRSCCGRFDAGGDTFSGTCGNPFGSRYPTTGEATVDCRYPRDSSSGKCGYGYAPACEAGEDGDRGIDLNDGSIMVGNGCSSCRLCSSRCATKGAAAGGGGFDGAILFFAEMLTCGSCILE